MGGGHDDAQGEDGARAGRATTPGHPAQGDARAQVGAPAAGAIGRTPDELLSTIGHDLRLPLNGLVGIVELLRGTRLDGEQRGYVDALQRSADALRAWSTTCWTCRASTAARWAWRAARSRRSGSLRT
ncbi:MAG: histidine kinase dimerization/phospho-acceptor domain-containing protein [Burkholderiales bacterium]|jgi:signal transduction histidine kinase